MVAAKACRDLVLGGGQALTGSDLADLDVDALAAALPKTAVFARVIPEDKARIVRVQRRGGGNGVPGRRGQRRPRLARRGRGHLSVDSATDIARDAADVILLENLDVFAEGRRIFANTIKYVPIGTSSNFGNMFSAAGASLFLSFLPMLPSQILLNNLLYDTSQPAIPTDNVDEEQLRKPSHWDIGFIRRFMLAFGPLSSMFDFATFGIMQWVFNAGPERFRSGWLVESLATQTLVIFAIRPRRIPFFRSRASRPLILSALGVVAIGTVLHDSPLASTLGFESLPWGYCAVLVAMVVAYLALVEAGKHLPYGLGPTAAARRRPDRTRHQRCRAARFSTRRKPGEAAVMRGGRRVRGHGKRPCRPPRAVVRRWRRP